MEKAIGIYILQSNHLVIDGLEVTGSDWSSIMLEAVSYTHLPAPETVLDIVCPLLLETKNNNKKKKQQTDMHLIIPLSCSHISPNHPL